MLLTLELEALAIDGIALGGIPLGSVLPAVDALLDTLCEPKEDIVCENSGGNLWIP